LFCFIQSGSSNHTSLNNDEEGNGVLFESARTFGRDIESFQTGGTFGDPCRIAEVNSISELDSELSGNELESDPELEEEMVMEERDEVTQQTQQTVEIVEIVMEEQDEVTQQTQQIGEVDMVEEERPQGRIQRSENRRRLRHQRSLIEFEQFRDSRVLRCSPTAVANNSSIPRNQVVSVIQSTEAILREPRLRRGCLKLPRQHLPRASQLLAAEWWLDNQASYGMTVKRFPHLRLTRSSTYNWKKQLQNMRKIHRINHDDATANKLASKQFLAGVKIWADRIY